VLRFLKQDKLWSDSVEISNKEEYLSSRDGSKIAKILQTFQPYSEESANRMLVEFHFKLLFSANKNKKSPTYMLKAILKSLKEIKFDREEEETRERAKEMIKIVKPTHYQFMIETFGLNDESEFF